MSQYTLPCDYSPCPYTPHPPTPSTTPITCAAACVQTQRWDSLVPFEKAMGRLYATLTDAVSFFKALDTSFDEETRLIQGYASNAVMEELWKCKITSSISRGEIGAPKREESSQQRYRNGFCGWARRSRHTSRQGQPGNAGQASFYEHLQSIDHDLLDAIYCRWPSEQAEPGEQQQAMSCLDVDGLNRLREKLWVQDQALRRITSTNWVVRVRCCLGEIVKESELLLFYLERARGLWEV